VETSTAAENFRISSSSAKHRSVPVSGLPPLGSPAIVEVDGATHCEDHEIAYDRRRDVYLGVEGYRIVRVLSDDISKHITDVLHMNLMGLEGRL
jgi:hypothetical protein